MTSWESEMCFGIHTANKGNEISIWLLLTYSNLSYLLWIVTWIAFTINMLSVLIQSQNHLYVGFILELVCFSFLSTELCWEVFGFSSSLRPKEIPGLRLCHSHLAGGLYLAMLDPNWFLLRDFPCVGVSQAGEPLPGGASAVCHPGGPWHARTRVWGCVPGVKPSSRPLWTFRTVAGTGRALAQAGRQALAACRAVPVLPGCVWGRSQLCHQPQVPVRPHTCDSHSIYKRSSSFPSMATLGTRLLHGIRHTMYSLWTLHLNTQAACKGLLCSGAGQPQTCLLYNSLFCACAMGWELCSCWVFNQSPFSQSIHFFCHKLHGSRLMAREGADGMFWPRGFFLRCNNWNRLIASRGATGRETFLVTFGVLAWGGTGRPRSVRAGTP